MCLKKNVLITIREIHAFDSKCGYNPLAFGMYNDLSLTV